MRIVLATLLLAALAACRNSSSTDLGLNVVPNGSGANGCSGPDQVFTLPQVPVPVALAALSIGPDSQITAAATGEILFATADDASVVMIDVSVDPPVETIVVTGDAIGDLLEGAGVTTPPALSGIAVLDADRLIVVEHTSNTLVTIGRAPPNTVAFYAGLPSETPGFADGLGQGPEPVARFSFESATQVCPTGDVPPKVFVADVGNHAVRVVQEEEAEPGVSVSVVTTVAGAGTAASSPDGDLSATFFDTPTGLSATCAGTLVVSELGGNRMRELDIGQPFFFGGYLGTSSTRVGNGTADTVAGEGDLARVNGPVSPLVTADGETYWIDSGSGVLRRQSSDGMSDCPLAIDCDAAELAPEFPAGHDFSLTETASGILYVLDATDGILYRVTP